MSSYDKIVKGACKPKPAPPKSKYLDPIIAATWADDGAVQDVCRALSPKFREPNTVVVFKALLVLHTMMRAGSTDNVLSCLSSQEVLRLRNVASGNWEGYRAPENLQSYAWYLDNRIRAYAELKHDPVRVQSESNRDMRVANNVEDQSDRVRGGSSSLGRSKTIRKLRVMTVEKGLLRETKIVQKVIESLLRCRFYLDDLEDDLTVTALRMLVKDLLVLFQAVNEGVINVLEHYFEMSHVDAKEALAIYRQFCKQTEKVVEYLGVAKKLHNLLNVPIPNLKHAPVSLAGALEEYLEDPNFEQNRIEYRAQKEAADRTEANGTSATSKTPPPPIPTLASSSNGTASTSTEAAQPAASVNGSKPAATAAIADFFSSIEEEQQTMFNPTSSSPSSAYFQQQAAQNPFHARQSMMMTGAAFANFPQPQQQQPTGFVQPQQTAFPIPPFQQPLMTGAPFGQPAVASTPFTTLGLQQTGFLQPQATGANPFRQSMLMPQMTGMAAFGTMVQASPFAQLQTQPGVASNSMSPFGTTPSSQPQQPLAQQMTGLPFGGPNNIGITPTGISPPARPQSTPITSNPASSFGQTIQAVKTHQTGSRNPFGQPAESVPPVPKAPTMFEIATGVRANEKIASAPSPTNSAPSQPQSTFGSSGLSSAFGKPAESGMANVASSFSFGGNRSTSPVLTNATGLTSTFTGSGLSAFSAQPTGTSATTATSAFSSSIQPQTTGFGGIKAFKPSSSFGALLLETLPTIPSQPSTPNDQTPAVPNAPLPAILSTAHGISPGSTTSSTLNNATSNGGGLTGLGSTTSFGSGGAQSTGFNVSSFGLGTQSTGFNPSGLAGAGNPGSTVAVGLRPQMTGGAANPFRASILAPQTTGPAFGSSGTTSPPPSLPPLPNFGSAGSINPSFTGAPSAFGTTGTSLFSAGAAKPAGTYFGGSAVPPFSGSLTNTSSAPQSQQQTGSLI